MIYKLMVILAILLLLLIITIHHLMIHNYNEYTNKDIQYIITTVTITYNIITYFY